MDGREAATARKAFDWERQHRLERGWVFIETVITFLFSSSYSPYLGPAKKMGSCYAQEIGYSAVAILTARW